MSAVARQVRCFPFVRLFADGGGRAVEVTLIAQLGVGAGDALIDRAAERQRHHDGFVDALDEPSVRLGAMSLAHGDASALYSFVVGPDGHPFHRHAGNRTFFAVSGSAGARLRFSAPGLADADAEGFVRALRHVTIPPDCLFTVRFGGGTWHRFEPMRPGHPALFALSCHPDEFGGSLAEPLRARVAANEADLAMLTDVLPDGFAARLAGVSGDDVPTVELALQESPSSALFRLCAAARGVAGRARARLARFRPAVGFRADRAAWPRAAGVPTGSMLLGTLVGSSHEDCVETEIPAHLADAHDDDSLLAALLEGFLANRPRAIGWMMAFRNRLVAPWKLRTSPIGCPVSSLLGEHDGPMFAGRFPVRAIRSSPGIREVMLGADDRHLRFRSVVGIRRHAGGATAWLATRVEPRNVFGRIYVAAIDPTHRRYIAPRLLQAALEHAARG